MYPEMSHTLNLYWLYWLYWLTNEQLPFSSVAALWSWNYQHRSLHLWQSSPSSSSFGSGTSSLAPLLLLGSPGYSWCWRWVQFQVIGNSHGSILQPTEFIQLDHEKHFKLILGGLLTATTIYVLSALVFSHWVEAGPNIWQLYILLFQEDVFRKCVIRFNIC